MPNPTLPLTGQEGGTIPQPDAKQGIMIYRNSTLYPANKNLNAQYIGRDWIDQLLAQTGCVGLRIWYGMAIDHIGNQVPQLYIVGVDNQNNDILTPPGQGMVVDNMNACPTFCPSGTALDR